MTVRLVIVVCTPSISTKIVSRWGSSRISSYYFEKLRTNWARPALTSPISKSSRSALCRYSTIAVEILASFYLCCPFRYSTASLSLLTWRKTVQFVQVQLSMRSSRWYSLRADRTSRM